MATNLKNWLEDSILQIHNALQPFKQRTAEMVTKALKDQGLWELVSQPEANKSVKSKSGPRRYSRSEKIAARKEWGELDRDENPITVEQWLETKFGTSPDGQLNVPKSTFYSWPKS